LFFGGDFHVKLTLHAVTLRAVTFTLRAVTLHAVACAPQVVARPATEGDIL
jgi:hypothetical protein